MSKSLSNRLCRNLFVYGTLRSTEHNEFARMLRERSTLLGPARVQGRLRRIEQYTGLVLSHEADDWVHGELFRLQEPRDLFAILDEYEGSEYQRVLATATLDSGTPARCWVYVYHPA